MIRRGGRSVVQTDWPPLAQAAWFREIRDFTSPDAVAPRTWQFWEDAQRGMPAGMLQLYLLLTGQTTVARARQALTAGMISPSPL